MLKKLLSLGMLVALLGCWIGCVTRNLVLHPITGKDFCKKGDPTCQVKDMDYGISEYYLNEVIDAKIELLKK